jgi:hypothetical protein
MLTLQEAVKYQAWDHLGRIQCDKLLDTMTASDELANAVINSDIPASFISEDEADRPAELLGQFKAALLDGSKADRVQAFQALESALLEWSAERIRSSESATDEWQELEKIAGRVPDRG